MTRDQVTRSTRTAANAAAAAVVAYAVLWFTTTQVDAIRDVSPFADDPWDAVASYAAIFLPIVAGATWVRSLRHRDPILPPPTAARIRWGAGLAVGIVLASVGADLLAITTTSAGAAGDFRWTLILVLVGVTATVGLLATALLVRASFVARGGRASGTDAAIAEEPDVVDDLLALAETVARPIGLGPPVGRLSAGIERFLDTSPLSPRRHRFLFGVVLAIATAVAVDAWQAVVEGGWASPVVPLVLGTLMAVGVLAIYLGTVGPLRLLRRV